MLKPGGFLCCYTGIPHVAAFLDHLRAAGLAYRWMISAVHRQASVRHSSSIQSQWSPILVLHKPGPMGDRWTTVNVFGDVFLDQQRDKSVHICQQPIGEAVALVEGLSGPGAVVADLFVCSGTVPAAVAMAGEGHKFVGFEADAKLAKTARFRVAQNLGGR
jgi:tRNA A58 N-methylase Trm61